MSAPTQALGIGQRIKSQADDRALGKFVDVHHRSWYATVEKATSHPAAPLRPLHWTAPLAPFAFRGRFIPDSKYLVIDADGAHDRLVSINYSQWLVDWDEAERDRSNLIRDLIANSSHGTDGAPGVDIQTIERWYEDPPKHILTAVGPGPAQKIPREFIEAMAEGNLWALGLSDRIPAWADKILARWERLQPVTPAVLGRRGKIEYRNAEDDDADVDAAADLDDEHEEKPAVRRGKPPQKKLVAAGGP